MPTAARLFGVRDVRQVDEPAPVPGPGESVVEVTAVGLCGSDLHWYAEGGIGDACLTRPLVAGHEPAVLRDASGVGNVQAFLAQRLTGRWATGLGLPSPIPLVAGTSDGQAAGLGADAGADGTGYLNLGTSMVTGVTASAYLTSPTRRSGPLRDRPPGATCWRPC